VLGARPSTMELLPYLVSFVDDASGNAPETWASIGTGTPPGIHGVRAIEAVRLAGSDKLLQSISNADITLRLFTRLGLGRKQPLPPAIRERDYVWEILGSRGVSSAGINWWASAESQQPALQSVSQESVYAATSQKPDTPPVDLAVAIDRVAIERLRKVIADPSLRFVTAYLPALDIVSNRVELPNSVLLAASVRVLDGVEAAIAELEQAGWDVIVVGADFVASTRELRENASRMDIAPTILDLFGFPASREMPGASLSPSTAQTRIRSYGTRRSSPPEKVDEEYYEKLKSLGYVR
jgi:type I phosphodiesterase/nucleotide pyrophosphatase